MMTLADMRALVSRYLRDNKQYKYSDAELDAILREAWRAVVDVMLEHPKGQERMWRPQAPMPIVAGLTSYPLPGDCLRVRSVQMRRDVVRRATLTCGAAGTTVVATWKAITAGSFGLFVDSRFYRISGINLASIATMDDVATKLQAAVRKATGGLETVTWATDRFVFAAYGDIAPLAAAETGTALEGTGFINGTAATPSIVPGAAWLDVPEGYGGTALVPSRSLLGLEAFAGPVGYTWQLIPGSRYLRISPRPLVADTLYRVWYVAEPAFPTAAADKIRDLPEGLDQILCYLATGFALNEEVEKQLPIGHFGNLAAGRLDAWLGGRAALYRPRLHITEVD